jgi:hypothetical protein
MNPIPYEDIARRLPLVPRSRPACHPLDVRVSQVVDLADAAIHQPEKALCSAAEACNLAALIASDCGLPALAADLCWRQFAIFAASRPFDSGAAKLALQPLINLGRLLTRDRRGTAAARLIQALFDAVTDQTAAEIGDRNVDLSGLTRTREDHREVLHWLWMVLLSDGTKALTQVGHWDQALHLVETHHGIGERLLDGRQIAIIARHTAGDRQTAQRLLAETVAPTPWEQAMAAVLAVLTGGRDTGTMMNRYLVLDPEPPAQVVFRVRLGLAVMDIAGTETLSTLRLASAIEADVLHSGDAYAARDTSTHPQFATVSTRKDVLKGLVDTAGLGLGTIPGRLLNQLSTAVRTAEESLADILRPPCFGSLSASPLDPSAGPHEDDSAAFRDGDQALTKTGGPPGTDLQARALQ